MSSAGKFLRKTLNGYAHWCPGCESVHVYRVDQPERPSWTFNEDFEKPDFKPSMLIFIPEHESDGVRHPRETECHYFINNGMISFCPDSPHKLSGQTVPLPPWPYPPGEYGGVED